MKYFENPAWVGSVTIHSAYLNCFKNHVYVVLNTCRFECSIQSSNSWSVTSVEEILIQTDHQVCNVFHYQIHVQVKVKESATTDY